MTQPFGLCSQDSSEAPSGDDSEAPGGDDGDSDSESESSRGDSDDDAGNAVIGNVAGVCEGGKKFGAQDRPHTAHPGWFLF